MLSAGNFSDVVVSTGFCAQITTGSPIPQGANAVIKVEETEVVSRKENGAELKVKIKVPVKVGQCIRPVGSDISKGQLVASAGDRLTPTEIGLLSSLGIVLVTVYPPPVVAILSTGNELVEPHETPLPGQIRDSNRPMLISSLRREYISKFVDMGIAVDDKDILEEKILNTLQSADILITSGGVSMGELDLLKPILEKIGTIHFGRILMKPGKPCTFATVNVNGVEKLVFGLPGNPVSSLACYYLFCVPCFRKAFGLVDYNLVKVQAKLKSDCRLDPERPEYLRATLKWAGDGFVAESTGNQQSSRLLSFRAANSLLLLPRQEGVLPAGTVVDALLVGDL